MVGQQFELIKQRYDMWLTFELVDIVWISVDNIYLRTNSPLLRVCSSMPLKTFCGMRISAKQSSSSMPTQWRTLVFTLRCASWAKIVYAIICTEMIPLTPPMADRTCRPQKHVEHLELLACTQQAIDNMLGHFTFHAKRCLVEITVRSTYIDA